MIWWQYNGVAMILNTVVICSVRFCWVSDRFNTYSAGLFNPKECRFMYHIYPGKVIWPKKIRPIKQYACIVIHTVGQSSTDSVPCISYQHQTSVAHPDLKSNLPQLFTAIPSVDTVVLKWKLAMIMIWLAWIQCACQKHFTSTRCGHFASNSLKKIAMFSQQQIVAVMDDTVKKVVLKHYVKECQCIYKTAISGGKTF